MVGLRRQDQTAGTAVFRAMPFPEDSAPKSALTDLATAGPRAGTRCSEQENGGPWVKEVLCQCHTAS